MAGKFAIDFDQGMKKVNTMLYKTGEEFDEFKNKALDFSSKFGIANADVTESIYQALSAGVKEDDIFKVLEVGAKASKGGFTDMATAIDGITNILNSYGLAADSSEKIANQMLVAQNLGKTTFGDLATTVSKVSPIFNQLDLGTNELFSSLAVLTANGIATSESVSALKAALSNIIKPTTEAKAAADALSISFDAKTLSDKGLIGFASYIQDAIKSAAPEYAKLAEEHEATINEMSSFENSKTKEGKARYKELKSLVSKQKADLEMLATAADSPIAGFANLFGSVEGLNAMLILGSEQGANLFNCTMKEMESNTEALNNAFNQMDSSKASEIQKTWVKLQNTLTKLGENLLPILSQGLDIVNSMLDKFNNLNPVTQQLLMGLVGASALVGPSFKIFGGGLKELSKIKSVLGSIKINKSTKDIERNLLNLGKSSKDLTKDLGSLTPLLTKTGIFTSAGLAIGVGAISAAICMVNKETNNMVKSFDYLGESMGENGEEFKELEGKIDSVRNKLGALTAAEVKITPEAQATFLGEVQLIVDEVKNNLDKKLEEDIELAKKRGYTEEDIEKVKYKTLSRKDEVEKNNQMIIEISNAAQKDNRSLTKEEQSEINNLMRNISKINMQSSGITLNEIDSYIALKNDPNNTKAEDLVPVIKELNQVVESQKELLKSKNVEEEKMLRFDLDNEKITKQEYENRISILESQYTQDLAEIERLRGEELVKMYETYGKVMDYININTGELENSITRFFTTLGMDAEMDKRAIVKQYGTSDQQQNILGDDYTKYNTKLQEHKTSIDNNTQSIDLHKQNIDLNKQSSEMDSLAIEDNMLKTQQSTLATQGLTGSVYSFDYFASQAATNINNAINGVNAKINELNNRSVNLPYGNNNKGISGVKMYSKGGIANEPSIFGENGPEIAIPLKQGNKRSEDLVRQAASILGMDMTGGGVPSVTGGSNSTSSNNINLSFNVTINGGSDTNVQKVMESAAINIKDKLRELLTEIELEKERASLGY